MEPITLLTLLFTKHILADYFLQRSWMFPDKGIYGAWGGVAHAKIHGLFTFLILLLFIPPVPALVFGALDSLIHYHIDYIKQHVWKSKKLTSMDNLYWMVHGVDQFLHFLTYVLIVLLTI